MNAFIKDNFFKREFVEKSEWRWWTGLLAGAAILFIPILTAAVIIAASILSQNSLADIAAHRTPNMSLNTLTVAIIVSQIPTIVLAIGFTRYKTSSWQSKLYITGFERLRGTLLPIIAVTVLIIVFTVIWEYLFSSTLVNDGDSIKGLLHSPETKFAAIVLAIIGAPVSEELLFRGFLLPPLSKTRFGFWGAALFTSLVWAAIHMYSWQGAAEIFMIGMAFSYLLWRTGSIIPSILLHTLFNTAFIAVEFATKT